MRRFGLIYFAWMLLCLTSLPCLAEGAVFDSPEQNYNQAVLWLQEEKYRVALALFEELKDYQDSNQYALYVQAMLAIDAAQWNDAQSIFESLAEMDFCDSTSMCDYVSARRLEEDGETEQALRLYRELTVLDSMERVSFLGDSLAQTSKAPEILLIQGDSQGIRFQWETNGDVDEYVVYRSMFAGYGFVEINRTIAATYYDTSICADKLYYYKVSAFKDSYESPLSDASQAKKVAAEGIDCPQSIILASMGSASTLAWSPVPGATAYHIYRSISEYGDYMLVNTTSEIYYTDENAGAICFYRVSARHGDGESKPSGPLEHSSAGTETIKNMELSNIKANMIDASSACVSWEGSLSGVYIVDCHVDGQPLGIILPVKGCSFSFDALAPNTNYGITITEASTGEQIDMALTTPAVVPYRTHNYRLQRCNIYWVRGGTGDFWQRNRTLVSSLPRDSLFSEETQGAYFILLEFAWSRTKEDKEWKELWVMRTPDGNVFTCTQEGVCAGSWDRVYTALPLASFQKKYGEDIAWETGTYWFEIYFDGEHVGESEIRIDSVSGASP